MCTHIHKYVYIHKYICMYTYVCIHVCIHMNVCMCVYYWYVAAVCMNVYVYTRVQCKCLHTYIQTHTHKISRTGKDLVTREYCVDI